MGCGERLQLERQTVCWDNEVHELATSSERRVGGGSAECTSAEGGGECRPHQEGA